jgi:hypothetical protein
MNTPLRELPPKLNFDIHHITTQQLQMLGISQLAYVKRVTVDGNTAWAIHAADGTPMAIATDPGSAIAAIHEHQMAAALVH